MLSRNSFGTLIVVAMTLGYATVYRYRYQCGMERAFALSAVQRSDAASSALSARSSAPPRP